VSRSVISIESAGRENEPSSTATRERHPTQSEADRKESKRPSSGIIYLDQDLGETISVRIPTGTRPGTWTILASEANDAALQAFDKTKPIILRAQGTVLGWQDKGIDGDFSFAFKELWLADRVGVEKMDDATVVRWTVEDNRRWMRGIRSFGEMNVDRFANEFEEFPGEVEDSNFAQYHRIPKFSLLRNTCKADGDTGFARFDAEAFRRFSAFEAVRFMLTDFFDIQPDRVRLPDGSDFRPKIVFAEPPEKLDNRHPIQNQSLEGPWALVTSRLMRMAHVSMVPNVDGEWVIFRLRPGEFRRAVGGYVGGGYPIQPDRSRSRSIIHRSYFRTRYDIRADYEDRIPTDGAGAPVLTSTVERDDPDNVLPVKVANVLIAPFDTTNPKTGVTIRRGSIPESFEVWIESLNAENEANPGLNFPKSFTDDFGPLTMGFIKSRIVGPMLASLLSVDLTRAGNRHPRGAAVAKTCYDFFRRLFQIPRELRDNLKKIKAEVGDVADTRTGKVAPSRVYFDHTLVLTYYGAFQPGKAPQEGAGFMTVRPWPVGDTQKLISEAEASDYARIRVYDQAQGLFLIQPLTDIEGNYGRVVFTTFGEFPPDAIVGLDGAAHFLETSRQDDVWRATWLFSAEVRSAHPRNFYVIPPFGTPDNGPREEGGPPNKGSGPVSEEIVRQAFANYAWVDGKSKTSIGKDGQLVFEGFRLANESRLLSIAKGLQRTHYFEQDDWLIGAFRAPGFVPGVDVPAGNYEVSWQHDGSGLFEAVYNTFRPVPPPVFEALSREAAALLFKIDEDTF